MDLKDNGYDNKGGPVKVCRLCRKIFGVPEKWKGDFCPRCKGRVLPAESLKRPDIR